MAEHARRPALHLAPPAPAVPSRSRVSVLPHEDGRIQAVVATMGLSGSNSRRCMALAGVIPPSVLGGRPLSSVATSSRRDQHRVPGLALYQGGDGRAAVRPQDYIPFPMARDGAVGDFGWSLADQDHVRDLASFGVRGPSGAPDRPAGPQVLVQVSAQMTAAWDVQPLVDRLGTHPHRELARIGARGHAPWSPGSSATGKGCAAAGQPTATHLMGQRCSRSVRSARH